MITQDFGTEKIDSIRKLGYEVIVKKDSKLNISEEIIDIDALVCFNPFKTLDISKLNNLKLIQLTTAGINQAPADIIREKGMILSNNRGGYSIPIGEWIVLKILEMAKNSKRFYKQQSEKTWKVDTSLTEIYGKTVGFIGTGDIAQEAAKRLKGFDTTILGLNTDGKDVMYFDRCYGNSQIKEMVGLCDIVVVSIPYTEKTHHLINKEVFDAMKDGVCMVNIARGSIIDEKEMINQLHNGKIKGAALDVFEEEPLSESNPLWSMENVIVTPHNSWASELVNERRFYIVYENLRRYISGEDLINVININKGY